MYAEPCIATGTVPRKRIGWNRRQNRTISTLRGCGSVGAKSLCSQVVVQFWLTLQAGEMGDPSLRLKNGYPQDDTGVVGWFAKVAHYRRPCKV